MVTSSSRLSKSTQPIFVKYPANAVKGLRYQALGGSRPFHAARFLGEMPRQLFPSSAHPLHLSASLRPAARCHPFGPPRLLALNIARTNATFAPPQFVDAVSKKQVAYFLHFHPDKTHRQVEWGTPDRHHCHRYCVHLVTLKTKTMFSGPSGEYSICKVKRLTWRWELPRTIDHRTFGQRISLP